jgi:DNA-binding HxlR family transcriptional regulator
LDWQNLIRRLAPLRTRWDVALLANLAGGDGPVRPVDLITAVNAQSDDGQLSWKVMEDRLRHLEASGYIARREVPNGPRETRYWLLPPRTPPAERPRTARRLVQRAGSGHRR